MCILTDCNTILKKKRLEETFFYSEDAISLKIGDVFSLDTEELSHLTKVFRAQEGDRFLLTDGQGRLFQAQLISYTKKGNQVQLLDLIQSTPKPTTLQINIGFLKGRDLEEVIDTCCQVNPTAIQALWTEHTQESPDKSHQKLFQRLRTKAITGLKQSKSLWLTKILEPVAFKEHLRASPSAEDAPLQIILDLDGELELSTQHQELLKDQGAELWIGPEGGFSSEEIASLKALPRAQTLKLGDFRLRAVTAPIFALGFIANYR